MKCWVSRSAAALAVAMLLAVAADIRPTLAQTVTPVAPAPSTPAAATPESNALAPETVQGIARLTQQIEQIERTVERVKDREEGLAVQRAEAEALLAEAQKLGETVRPRLDEVRLQIEKLGKPPAAAAAPESEAVAAERTRLTALSAQLDGAFKTTELVQVRTRQQISRIQDFRHTVFARDLLKRAQSPLRPAIWQQVGQEIPRIRLQAGSLAGTWRAMAQPDAASLIWLLAFASVTYIGLTILLGRTCSRMLAPVPEPPPDFFARAGTATWVAAARALPVIATALTLYFGLDALGLLTYQVSPLAEAVTAAVIAAAGVSGLAVALLTPRYPHWRLVDLSDASAWRLVALTRWIAVVFAADLVVRELIRTLSLTLPVSVAQTFLTSMAFAGLLIGIVRTRFEPRALATSGSAASLYRPHWLKLPLLAAALTILGLSLLGYIALGSFIASQMTLMGSCLVVFVVLHLAIGALATEPEDINRPVGRMLESELGLDLNRRRQLSRAMTWVLNLGLLLAAVPVVLLAWGFSALEIATSLKGLIFGFEIGQFKISLARILIAIGLFAGMLFTTRLLQRWLGATVLKPARMDAGIAHSIHTGIGYAGFAIAGLFAVSYAGLDITSLAIVAGALSVGIGFGLQSIVNNFVSGLILLVERPIKVGDWIVVKGQEGYVRRISVRATEIETFDRASIMLPNSELITGSVMNWTHRNAMGRIVIKVSASYHSDPERVMAILGEVAERNTSIMRQPAPRVSFDELGANGLEFSLRVHVADINNALDAQTGLRLDIFKSFSEAGIEIPFTPYDIHLRNTENARTAFAKALETRQREQTATAAE